MNGECPYYKRRAEHEHDFHPTGIRKIDELGMIKKEQELREENPDVNGIEWNGYYMYIHKWMCECGAVKWIREEKE